MCSFQLLAMKMFMTLTVLFRNERSVVLIIIMVFSGALVSQQLIGLLPTFSSTINDYDQGYELGCSNTHRVNTGETK